MHACHSSCCGGWLSAPACVCDSTHARIGPGCCSGCRSPPVVPGRVRSSPLFAGGLARRRRLGSLALATLFKMAGPLTVARRPRQRIMVMMIIASPQRPGSGGGRAPSWAADDYWRCLTPPGEDTETPHDPKIKIPGFYFPNPKFHVLRIRFNGVRLLQNIRVAKLPLKFGANINNFKIIFGF